MRKRVVWSAVVALFTGGQALADGMSYNYLAGGLYASQVKKGGDSDGGVGYKFEGAISNNMPVFVFFNLGANKYPDASDNLRVTNVSAGVGGHRSLTASLDAVGSLSYESVDIKYTLPEDVVPSLGTPDLAPPRGGIGVSAGLRGRFGTSIEWTAGVKYRDLKSSDSVINVSVGGRYFITPALALGVEFSGLKYDMMFRVKDRLDDEFYEADLRDTKEYTALVTLRYQFSDPW